LLIKNISFKSSQHENALFKRKLYFDLIAAMAKYSPFAEKAGMQKIADHQSTRSFSKVSKTLLEVGFD
jgi:hypothetical protein